MSRLVRAGLEAAAYIAAICGVSVVAVLLAAALFWVPTLFATPELRLAAVGGEIIVGVWAVMTLAFWRAGTDE